MNSFLQSLFMTPDFCQLLFSWEYKPLRKPSADVDFLHKAQEEDEEDEELGAIKASNNHSVDPFMSGDFPDDDPEMAQILALSLSEFKKSDSSLIESSDQKSDEVVGSRVRETVSTNKKKMLSIEEYNEKEERRKARCIPLQLQRLFARLQLSSKSVIDTTALTKSFGWDNDEAFQQQDVQELRLILFDALETVFRAYESSLINNQQHSKENNHSSNGNGNGNGDNNSLCRHQHLLHISPHPTNRAERLRQIFEGQTESYTLCLSCKNRKSQLESFTDLQLVVRDLSTLQQSFSSYLEPELLSGDNQYFCSVCDKKSDAYRGISLYSLPPVLTLQLKRFDYNPRTWAREKLNHFFSFPPQFDFSTFIGSNRPLERELNSQDDHDKPLNNDLVYDLFGICVHSGGAMGGHYYAYLESPQNGKWYLMDDSRVEESSWDDVQKTFGFEDGPSPTTSPSLSASSTVSKSFGTAYMLIYRRREAHGMPRQVPFPDQEMASPIYPIPQSIIDEIEKENQEFFTEKQEFLLRRDTLHLHLFYGDARTQVISAHKQKTIQQVTEIIFEKMRQSTEISEADPLRNPSCSINDVRIVRYNKSTHTSLGPFKANERFQSLSELQVIDGCPLLLEVKAADSEWPEEAGNDMHYREQTITFHLFYFDVENKQVRNAEDPIVIDLPKSKIGFDELLIVALQMFSLKSPELIRISKVNPSNFVVSEIVVGCDASSDPTLLIDRQSIYIEENPSKDSPVTGFSEKFDFDRHSIEIKFNAIGSAIANLQVQIDSRLPLRNLKMQIAHTLNLEIDQFKLVNNPLSKKELKSLDESLHKCGIFDGSAVYVIPGRPLKANEASLKIYLYTQNRRNPRKEQELQEFELLHPNFIVCTDQSLGELEDRLRRKIAKGVRIQKANPNLSLSNNSNDMAPSSSPTSEREEENASDHPQHQQRILKPDEIPLLPSLPVGHSSTSLSTKESTDFLVSREIGPHIRWRVKVAKRPGKILPYDKALKQMFSKLPDGMELIIQELPSAMQTVISDLENKIVIQLLKFFPSEWRLSSHKEELVMLKSASIFELKVQLSGILSSDPLEAARYIQIAKLPTSSVNGPSSASRSASPLGFKDNSSATLPLNDDDIMTIACLNWEVPDHHQISHSPWYTVDGQVLFYKDSREKNKFELDPSLLTFNRTGVSDGGGIVIHTKFEEDDFEDYYD